MTAQKAFEAAAEAYTAACLAAGALAVAARTDPNGPVFVQRYQDLWAGQLTALRTVRSIEGAPGGLYARVFPAVPGSGAPVQLSDAE